MMQKSNYYTILPDSQSLFLHVLDPIGAKYNVLYLSPQQSSNNPFLIYTQTTYCLTRETNICHKLLTMITPYDWRHYLVIKVFMTSGQGVPLRHLRRVRPRRDSRHQQPRAAQRGDQGAKTGGEKKSLGLSKGISCKSKRITKRIKPKYK